jgi:hypothetical protein
VTLEALLRRDRAVAAAALSVGVLVQKLLPAVRATAWGTGAALLAWGVAVLARSL